ncbi:MAG: type I methionyl aminopeptidase [Candidatus Kapabacteria bacterium]|nr:type I methionyl aminopeptidase [Ignavibacteria bacterium]MBP6509053.1 type I methionyl aminopeptidase [Candidatus Kapabacteria bacterium]MBK6419382.1 type I methionyl aminopeptidase [Ignavibacteria bacterium]MBK7413678.1 type I methionyl aminopeptidase [Ignavibacteria bacterium]MBK9182757.1 type I methionyl aminopeptidase [Ignavibacteria bacterium]
MAVADLSIALLTGDEIKKMEAASRIVADVLNHMKGFVKPGVTTIELDAIVEDFIRTRGGEPAFKGYEVDGKLFPSSACISVDEEVVHGMPGQRMLKEGQIVTIDVGVQLDGFFGDSAYTYGVGEISTDKQRLLDATKESLRLGIEQAIDGNRVYDIARAVQTHVEKQGFSVVRELVGHGIGRHLHEEPPVPNFVPGLLHRSRFPNAKLKSGMALAIEPMVNMGLFHVHTASDGWTVYTADGKPSAHFEHTIVIDGATPRILTLME